MPSGKRIAAQMRGLSALAAAQPEEIRTRRQAAEETYQGILNRLGAEGTYGDVQGGGGQFGGAGATGTMSSLVGGAGSDPGSPPSDASIFKTEKAQGKYARDVDLRRNTVDNIQDITRLDPKATLASIEKSSQFQTMSRLQAESQQLLERKGPLFEEMQKNLQNPIIEGNAVLARENARAIQDAMARGGAARRGAFEAVQKMRQQEQINYQRVTAINQSRMSLDKWARDNARTNLEFGQNWASNVGGVRESFNAAMDNAAELMTTAALPIMLTATQAANDARDAAHAKSQSGVIRWVKGIVGAVLMWYSGGAVGGGLVEGAIQGPQAGDTGSQVGTALSQLASYKGKQAGPADGGVGQVQGPQQLAYGKVKGQVMSGLDKLSETGTSIKQNVSAIGRDLGIGDGVGRF